MKKVTNLVKALIPLILLFVFCSCAPLITLRCLNDARRGMSTQELRNILYFKPKRIYSVVKGSETYKIQVYRMQTGVNSGGYGGMYPMQTGVNSGGFGVLGGLGGAGFFTVPTPVTEDYFFILKDDKLVYWGFMYELNRSDNENIVKLAEMISARDAQNKKLSPKKKTNN